jgi:hexosaminidase
MIRHCIAVLSLLAAPLAAQAPDTTRPALIPWPAAYRADTGRWLPTREISLRTLQSIPTSHALLNEQARQIVEEAFGAPTSGWVMRGPDARAVVQLLLTPGGTPDSMREAYHLKVSPHLILIEAGTETGLFYGLQTLRQLAASPGNGPRLGVPALEIWDRPRFQWRGLHLDVARHFFPVAFVERYIDLMARYKYNTFHWHLTDDQGWRIEINGYPRFTSVGAWRKETIREKNFDPYIGDSIPYGGYYTQEEIREVVRYAAERHVTIVPEIEMPGHAKAAVAAYPELACTPGPFEVGTIWGVEDDIYCPTEQTFKVLEDVLTQVMALFPSKFIHIGGDEVPKIRWQQSRFAQGLMRREGLHNEEQLQSWFVRRIERFLNAHGRRLVGWDEILEGGIAPEATVMSWRGTAGGIVAAQAGHDVIMTPGAFVYFDHLQGPQATEPLSIGGYTPLEKTYAFEPVPAELTVSQARHILGAQANMWTEYVATPQHVEYMMYPRALALSEVLWSPTTARDWTGFTGRLPTVLQTLDALRVNYRIPDVAGLEGGDQVTLAESTLVALRAAAAGKIHYTLDSTDPTLQSPTYMTPLALHLGEKPVAVTARLETADGRLGMPRSASWRRAKWLDAQRSDAAGLQPGLNYTYAEGRADSIGGVAALPVTGAGIVPAVQLAGTERPERFAVTLEGWLQVPVDALYEFSLSSDDGSILWVDGQKVVDNDGYHGPDPKQGAAALRTGMHRVKVMMFQGGGAKSLALGWRRQGDATFYPVSGAALFRSP